MRVVDGPLAEHRRSPRDQRSVDDVAVADHPADVRGAPENVVVLHVPEVLEVVVSPHHVAAVDVLHALGLAGGAAGVEDVQRVLGVHLLGLAVHAARGHQRIEVHLAGAQRRSFIRRPLAPPDDDLLDQVQVLDSALGDAQQVHLVAPPVPHVGGDDHLGLRVGDAVAEGARAEPSVHHAVHRADAGAGQHGDGALRRQRHVDDHPVALAHAQGAQAVGEPVDQLRQPPVGERTLGAVLAQPDEGGLVPVAVGQVPVQGVLGDVALRPQEPSEGGVVPLEDAVPSPRPFQLRGHPLPEPLLRVHRITVLAFVVLQKGLPHQEVGRQYLPGLLKQVVNLSLLHHVAAPLLPVFSTDYGD